MAKSKLDREIEVLFPKKEFVTTVDGERIEVPKSTLRVQLQVVQSLGRILKRFPQDVLEGEEFDLQKGIGIVAEILETLPEEVLKIASVIVGRDEEWVAENLDLDSVVELILPFYEEVIRKLGKVAAIQDKMSRFLK